MNKRSFLKKSAAVAGLLTGSVLPTFGADTEDTQVPAKKKKPKFLIWLNVDTKASDGELELKFQKFAESGVDILLFQQTDERNYRLAKKQGMQAHRWLWALNCTDRDFMAKNQGLFSISRSGKSCATNPPYVDYYRWMCPSKLEVSNYIVKQAKNLAALDFVDGVHLDYIRYPDVILPVDLWKKYGITQHQEHDDYDFCYCDDCRNKFRELTGRSINADHPDQDLSWRAFRYDRVTEIVNRVKGEISATGKPLSAAVFPTPEIAKRIVRQDWLAWDLDFVCPMIYQSFYQEKVGWVGTATKEGTTALAGRKPLYAGLYLPAFESGHEIKQGIDLALANGAAGVSIFGDVDEHLLALIKSYKN